MHSSPNAPYLKSSHLVRQVELQQAHGSHQLQDSLAQQEGPQLQGPHAHHQSTAEQVHRNAVIHHHAAPFILEDVQLFKFGVEGHVLCN